MPAISAYAPAKIILFGEHAVVYGYPAIAGPVNQLRARTSVMADPRAGSGEVRIQAPDINLDTDLVELPENNPLGHAVRLVYAELGVERGPACTIRVTSDIPPASGLGSGAAVSVSLIRALSAFIGHPLSNERVNELAYEVEKLYHGTPSGIDNTVVTYASAVYFMRGQKLELLDIPESFSIVIADTGIATPTSVTVGDVRQAWQNDREHYDAIFERVGEIVNHARRAIEAGEIFEIGKLMTANHGFLQQMNVSCEALDRLVESALAAGALGAKMSGGGRGGNMIALGAPDTSQQVADALAISGAVRTIITTVG